MDTSAQYIEMCSKATEIQGRQWLIGDIAVDLWSDGSPTRPCVVVALADEDGFILARSSDDRAKLEILAVKAIWLPRQDDLQEMVADWGWRGPLAQMIMLDRWLTETEENPNVSRDSWEQVWLQFVLAKKYGKTWDGREWVK